MSNITNKVIVTNMSALKAKYDTAGTKKIESAVKKLVLADKRRGLTTIFIGLDDAATMKKLKAPRVTVTTPDLQNSKHAKQYKRAIDGVYKAYAPDYLVLLGAIDVIPHQDLLNPLYTGAPDGDPDPFAFGDVPYACEAPYSQRPEDFIGVTRVVGRLPDLTGAQGSPDYLLNLLRRASEWKALPAAEYRKYLGISTEVWKDSTDLSLTNIFGSSSNLQLSPRAGHRWKAALINSRAHFINCHGGDTYPNFLGQSSLDGREMPVSHEAAYVGGAGKIKEGTVAAVECCYGGQLYDPVAVGQAGMCNTYLANGAYGFFASTTVAYGPATGNDAADLICQYFLRLVIDGASTGRAALEARQMFVKTASPISPTNLKTLAQFNLYGDPSIAPVVAASPHIAVGSKNAMVAKGLRGMAGASGALLPKTGSADAKALQDTEAHHRAERRDKLRVEGLVMTQTQAVANHDQSAPSPAVQDSMQKFARQFNLTPSAMLSFNVPAPPAAKSATLPKSPLGGSLRGITKNVASPSTDAASSASGTTAFHVIIGVKKPNASPAATSSGGQTRGGLQAKTPVGGSVAKNVNRGAAGEAIPPAHIVPKFFVLEAKEVNGTIVAVSELHSK